MTLRAFAPNGLEITHEFWMRTYTSPVDFERDDTADEDDGNVMAEGIVAMIDYDANSELDIEYRTEGDEQHSRELRWQDTNGGLWAKEDLTFKEVDDD